MAQRGGSRDRSGKQPPRNTLFLYERARQLMDYLVENNGHLPFPKEEIAVLLAQRFDTRTWLTFDGKGDRRLLEQICTMSREQVADPIAATIFAGYVISYAPNRGGLTLVDESGEMPLHMALHVLKGDLTQQSNYLSVWRRRLPVWAAAATNAALSDDPELARILWRIHDKIEETGFTLDELIREYVAALVERGLGNDDQ